MAEFNHRDMKNHWLLAIKGRFTLVDKDHFQAALQNNQDSDKTICLDASGLEFIDSSGIGDLLKLKMEAAKNQKQICIFGLHDAVLKSFKIAKLDSVFEILSKEEYQNRFS